MKLRLLATAALLGSHLSTVALRGESYQLSSVVLGGGTPSTGGIYSMDSVFGQPLVSSVAGGDFQLGGGFWAATQVVPGESFPTLSIVWNPNQIVISWPSGPAAFVLQQTDFLSPANWVSLEVAPPNSVVIPAGGKARFFRLIRK